ncbi:Putative vesicle-associated membrane protein 726 [Dendrobium catenatum]|uniref:Vesicle-associated membrane protein 726 n=1 Tax=Dendrobium catenatum TaxID=906689 RepID=A0A2I0VWF1_9ASPA|nr:Putative vesicle-associated membrane protein 726 [Dendrobium catenatum]
MGQQSLTCSFVARGTVILAEYTKFTGNFTSIASQCLQKLPASNNKFTYNCDNHTFNYLVENNFCTYENLFYITFAKDLLDILATNKGLARCLIIK